MNLRIPETVTITADERFTCPQCGHHFGYGDFERTCAHMEQHGWKLLSKRPERQPRPKTDPVKEGPGWLEVKGPAAPPKPLQTSDVLGPMPKITAVFIRPAAVSPR